MKKRALGFQQKLVLAFLVILLGIVLSTSIVYKMAERQAVDAVIDTYMGNLSYAGKLLQKEMRSLEAAYDFLSTSPSIQKALAVDRANKQEHYQVHLECNEVISAYFSRTSLTSDFAVLRVFGDNGVVLREGGNSQMDEEINIGNTKQEPWSTMLRKNPRGVSWLGIQPNAYYSQRQREEMLQNPGYELYNSQRAYVFGYIGNILSNNSLQTEGVLYLAFYPQFFSSLLENFDSSEGETTLIVDQYGNILFGLDRTLIGTPYEKDSRLREGNGDAGYFVEGLGTQEHLTAYYPLTDNGWYLIKTIEFTEITRGSRAAFMNNMAFLTLLAVVSLFMWYLISYKFIEPIRKLSAAMDSVQAGNLLVKVDESSNDEVGALSRNFNYMTDRISRLFQQVIDEQTQKKQMEFIALQAQLNPHFLQNTLNSIRWMAVIQRANNIKELTDALSRLLINVTNKADQFITIGEEIRINQDYIYIQKIRYGDKFRVWYQVDPALLGHKCLKFMLQPLLENAIYHGIEPKEDMGTILICAYTEHDEVVISVQDDGVGIPEELAKELLQREGLRSSRFSGIGLKNLHERIGLIYGENYGLRITSKMGSWTEIVIQFPLEKPGKGSGQ